MKPEIDKSLQLVTLIIWDDNVIDFALCLANEWSSLV